MHFYSTPQFINMNRKVLMVLILLALNLCCADSAIVSFIKSSSSTVSNWYDYYIKPLWTSLTIQSNAPPDADIGFYENEEVNYSPSNGENVIFMDSNGDELGDDEEKDDEYYTYLSNYDENFYDQMHKNERTNDSEETGIFYRLLKFIGYYPSSSSDNQNILRPYLTSNQTDGLDVRLILLFKKSSNNKLIDSKERQLKLILPGTLWCGDGTIAKSDQDLGIFYKTDQCCKEHDWCPKYIESGQSFMNLENNGAFTRSHCECDRSFYKCLKKANSIISNRIGETYFNVLQPQCFMKEYPVVGCIKRRHDKRCFNFVLDDSAKKTWQWFDNKKY